MDTVCICSKYHTFSLISRCSFSCSDSIDDDTYEFTTSRSPKIENMCLHFYGISFKVKDAMIGVLKDMLYIQAVGLPCSLGRSGCFWPAWPRTGPAARNRISFKVQDLAPSRTHWRSYTLQFLTEEDNGHRNIPLQIFLVSLSVFLTSSVDPI